ncbi:hypothetical protein CYMTET_32452 [Cymbomonas tetramitiformis]|nr:hypothetical protein CYMTET_32452 [Cymbomonas tetramitiformis]
MTLPQIKTTDPYADVDDEPESMLSFSGTIQVHALFNFLLSYCMTRGMTEGGSVPTLLAPVPFQNAVVNSLPLQCGHVRRAEPVAEQRNAGDAANAEMADADGCVTVFTAECKQLVPPWVASRLCCLFAQTQEGGFEAVFDTDPRCQRLNVHSSVPPLLQEGASGSLGRKSEDEYALMRDSHMLHQHAVRQIRLKGGRFTSTLHV